MSPPCLRRAPFATTLLCPQKRKLIVVGSSGEISAPPPPFALWVTLGNDSPSRSHHSLKQENGANACVIELLRVVIYFNVKGIAHARYIAQALNGGLCHY